MSAPKSIRVYVVDDEMEELKKMKEETGQSYSNIMRAGLVALSKDKELFTQSLFDILINRA